MRDLTRLFLESNTARMPAPIERGLEDLFSTIEVAGIRITLGKPIAQPNRDWARVHLLATSTDYYGKLRVILSNLRRGVPPDAAYRNAVAKTPAEIDRETDAYLAARNFPTTQVSPRPMSERDFTERAVEPAAARLALADLLLPDSRAAYQALIAEKLHVTEAHEGLALLALKGRGQGSRAARVRRRHRRGQRRRPLLPRIRPPGARLRQGPRRAPPRRQAQPQAGRGAFPHRAARKRSRPPPRRAQVRRRTEPARRRVVGGARRGVPCAEGFSRRREGVDLRRAGRHRRRRARPLSEVPPRHRTAAPGLRSLRTQTQSRRGGARYRKAQGAGARRSARAGGARQPRRRAG